VLDLSQLTKVSDHISVQENGVTKNAKKITKMSDIAIYNNEQLYTVKMPLLAGVGIEQTKARRRMSDVVVEMAGTVTIELNIVLETLSIPLDHIRHLEMHSNVKLKAFPLALLSTLTGNLRVTFHHLLTLELEKLTTVFGNVEILNNPNLVSVKMDKLEMVTGGFSIHDNIVLPEMELTTLRKVGGHMTIRNNAMLKTAFFPKLVSMAAPDGAAPSQAQIKDASGNCQAAWQACEVDFCFGSKMVVLQTGQLLKKRIFRSCQGLAGQALADCTHASGEDPVELFACNAGCVPAKVRRDHTCDTY
jgi:hypothetical protein